MPIRTLDLGELFDQPPLLTSTYWHLNLSGQHVAAGIIHPPPRGNRARTSRRIELELPDVFLCQQENTTGLVGRETSEINITVHPFIGNPQHLCRLFNRNIS